MDIGKEQRIVRVVPEPYPEQAPDAIPHEPAPKPVSPEPDLVPA